MRSLVGVSTTRVSCCAWSTARASSGSRAWSASRSPTVLVLAMRDAGDVFGAVPLDLVFCATAMVLCTEPLHWMRNPFCRPDLAGFVARGWGTWSVQDGRREIAFTPAALERLRKHVVS